MTEAVRYDVVAGVATLVMDEPETRNALTPALLEGLGDRLSQAAADHSVRTVVLSHTGPAFCAGADLKSGGMAGPAPRHDLAEVLSLILDMSKPVIARIAGHCMGGGVGLAAACDLSVAAASVRFGFSEVRLGVAPAVISVVVLPKLRRGDALELFLTGERFDAVRAADIGLITRAVAPEDLDDAVGLLLEQLHRGAPGALAAAKRLVFEIPGLDQASGFEQAARLSRSLFGSEEAAEGMAAFRERRQPAWAPHDPHPGGR